MFMSLHSALRSSSLWAQPQRHAYSFVVPAIVVEPAPDLSSDFNPSVYQKLPCPGKLSFFRSLSSRDEIATIHFHPKWKRCEIKSVLIPNKGSPTSGSLVCLGLSLHRPKDLRWYAELVALPLMSRCKGVLPKLSLKRRRWGAHWHRPVKQHYHFWF